MTTRKDIIGIINDLKTGLKEVREKKKTYDDILYEFNIHRMTSKRKIIATIWDVDDIRSSISDRTEIDLAKIKEKELIEILNDLSEQLDEQAVSNGWDLINDEMSSRFDEQEVKRINKRK